MLISDVLKQGWCQQCQAKTVTGEPVVYNDDRAVSWCILGALWKSNQVGLLVSLGRFLEKKYPKLKDIDAITSKIVCVNDVICTTQNQIIALIQEFEECIASC